MASLFETQYGADKRQAGLLNVITLLAQSLPNDPSPPVPSSTCIVPAALDKMCWSYRIIRNITFI